MTKSRKDPWKPRHCRLCKAVFKPAGKNPGNAEKQEFCCAAHRKEFWKHGALPFHKLMDRVERRVREIVKEEVREIVADEVSRQAGSAITSGITSNGVDVASFMKP